MKAIIVGDLLKVDTFKWTPPEGQEIDLYSGILFDVDAFKDTDSLFKFKINSKQGAVLLEKGKKLLNKTVRLSGYLTTRDGERKFEALDIEEVKS